MEVVQANKQPFIAATISMEVMYYDQEFGSIKFIRKRRDEFSRKAYMDSKCFMEIQKKAAKPLKLTIIVPYRASSDPIIEDIDDD